MNWHQKTNLGWYADQYQLIIVCPEGGYASWYFNSPVKVRSQYTTFVGEELMRYIDHQYRTYNLLNSYAVGGLGMGGHGALYLLIRVCP